MQRTATTSAKSHRHLQKTGARQFALLMGWQWQRNWAIMGARGLWWSVTGEGVVGSSPWAARQHRASCPSPLFAFGVLLRVPLLIGLTL